MRGTPASASTCHRRWHKPLESRGGASGKKCNYWHQSGEERLPGHGIDEHGKLVLKKPLRRDQMAKFSTNRLRCFIGMAVTAVRISRGASMQSMGHTVRG